MTPEGFKFKDWCKRCNAYTDHVNKRTQGGYRGICEECRPKITNQ